MSDTAMPSGLMPHIKAAIRAQVLACAAPGSTGPQRVKDLTGYSAGAISRWQGDAHAELPPLEVVAQLEFATQLPILARMFAALTGHRLVPVTDGDEEASLSIADMLGIAATAGQLQAGIAEALEDGVVTPQEAAHLRKLKARHMNEVTQFGRKLGGFVTPHEGE